MSDTLLVHRGRVKPVIPGSCNGDVVLVDSYISFFAEVNPDTGCLVAPSELCFRDAVLVFRGTRGSTVAPYIIYALRRNNTAPRCILVAEAEPMLIAGCVLAEIPLYVVEDYEGLVSSIRLAKKSAYLEVREHEALLYERV